MGKFQLEDSIGRFVTKANVYIKAYFTKLIRENGYMMTVEQWTLLLIISQNPGKTQTEIAEMGLKDKTNVTRILDILEKNNHIQRLPDSSDRRKYRIRITKQGEKILQNLFPIAEQVHKKAIEGLTEKDLAVLCKALDIVNSNLKESL